MSCYAVRSSLALAHVRHAVMLRCAIFSCTCTHMSCYAVGSSLALAHVRHATLCYLLLHMHTDVMLRCGIFSCTCTRTSSWDLTHFSATSSEIATIQQCCHFDASCSSVCLPRFLFGVAFLSVLPSRIVKHDGDESWKHNRVPLLFWCFHEEAHVRSYVVVGIHPQCRDF